MSNKFISLLSSSRVHILLYSLDVIKNINKDNVIKIINFLTLENCDYIEDILEDYLDIFTIEYEEFVNKYHKLNAKYNFNLLTQATEDMNILEEFFED